MGITEQPMPGPSVCVGVCGGVRKKKRGGGAISLCCAMPQSIPFYTHTTKLTTVATNKTLEKSFFKSKQNVFRFTKVQTHAQIHMHLPSFYPDWHLLSVWFNPTCPLSWEVWWAPSDKKSWSLLFLDMWTAGAFCVMTPAATSGACVSVYGACIWRVLPHLGGNPAVPFFTRLDSVLQTPSCHSGLPGAHLTVRGETLATCASTLPHLLCVCVCVSVCMWEAVCCWVCVCDTEGTCMSSGLRLQSSHLSVENTPRKTHQAL